VKIVETPITDRDSWLLMRQRDLTASDIGALLGINRYKTPLQVYAEKAGEVSPQSKDTPAMKRGRYFELAVLEEFQDHHPELMVVRPRIYLRCPELRIGCTPDAITVDREVNVQLKTVDRDVYDDKWGNGPPFSYQLQTLTETMLLKAKRAILAVHIHGFKSFEYEEYPIERNPKAEARILALVEAFWQDIQLGIRPPPEAGDLGTIKEIYPPMIEDPPLDLTSDNRAMEAVTRMKAIGAEINELDEEKKGLQAELIAKLAGHKKANLPQGWRLTYNTVHYKERITKAYDVQMLKSFAPKGVK
jgi:predicted phage-related endonuclease